MAKLGSLLKDSVLYGLSSIVGRFLNYLLVPIHTRVLPVEEGGFGVVTNLYGYTALLLVLLTCGMETTYFYYANKGEYKHDTVFSTAIAFVGTLSVLFAGCVLLFLDPICSTLGYSDHPEYVWMMAVIVALDALQALPFSMLRFQHRPIKFVSLKLLFIVLNVALNVFFYLVLDKNQVGYIFLINLIGTVLCTFGFFPELLKMKWHFDAKLFGQMLRYTWPLLVLGVVGILNQTFDKIAFPLVYPDAAMAKSLLAEYGGCVKIAMIMAIILQAFRYAYEPIVFSLGKEKGSKEFYAETMKYFVIFVLLAFLCVMAWIEVIQRFVGEDYRAAIGVVPIVMAAEIMMGIFFNLSFWYKLIDKTIWGAWFSLAGCVALVAVNWFCIPLYGYWACAWGGVAGYGVCMLLSYCVGQKKNPIPYDMKRIGTYVTLALALYVCMEWMPLEGWMSLLAKSCLIFVYAGVFVALDMPKSFKQRVKSAIFGKRNG
ncbi:MAG: lipopolysaccharide biosynthesis protein [Bacteroidales bacterium]|nr:lipopolysaccharide biosynthesis protein [Bacteroidales bacterium]